MAEAQRQGVRVLLTGKCGNWTVSWNGSGLIRSLVGTGQMGCGVARNPRHGAGQPGPARRRALVSGGLIPQLPWRVQLAIARRRSGDDPLLASEAWWAPLSPIHPEFARAQNVAARSRARGYDHWFRRRIDTPQRRFGSADARAAPGRHQRCLPGPLRNGRPRPDRGRADRRVLPVAAGGAVPPRRVYHDG